MAKPDHVVGKMTELFDLGLVSGFVLGTRGVAQNYGPHT